MNRDHLGLRADAVLIQARTEAAASDFGDECFLQNYRALVEGINHEVQLSGARLAALSENIVRLLVNRLRMERDIQHHPEILQEVLAPPIVITGFPRTGSTKLQRLHFWQLHNVAPFPGAVPGHPDPRIAAARAVEDYLRHYHPEAWATHPSPALDADEDFYAAELSFLCPTLPTRVGAAAIEGTLAPPSPKLYRHLRRTLQYLQWQQRAPDRDRRPWVLKSPIHLGALRTIIDVFPGVKIVHCHRDLEVSVASAAAMMAVAEESFLGCVDRRVMGARILRYWATQVIQSPVWCFMGWGDMVR